MRLYAERHVMAFVSVSQSALDFDTNVMSCVCGERWGALRILACV